MIIIRYERLTKCFFDILTSIYGPGLYVPGPYAPGPYGLGSLIIWNLRILYLKSNILRDHI